MTTDVAEFPPTDRVSRRRWRIRFGLRGLIVMVTLAAIIFAPFGMIARRKQREQRAIGALTGLGAEMRLNHPNTRIEALSRHFWGNPWEVRFGLHFALGHDETWNPPHDLAVVVFPRPTSSKVLDLSEESVEAFVEEHWITDEKMPAIVESLRTLGRIQRLSIDSQVLTDDGLVELCDAPEISELDLRCPLVTSHGTDVLQQKFPKLVILDD